MMLKVNKIIGIDPGLSNGAVCVLTSTGYVGGKLPNSIQGIQKLLQEQSNGHSVLVVLEKVQVWTGDEATPGKRFGIDKLTSHHAQLLSSIALLNLPLIQAHPATWQSFLKLKKYKENITKQERKERYWEAAQMYAGKAVPRYQADAFCLAEFGWRKLKDQKWMSKHIENISAEVLF
jgi:hypothetical protein